MTYVKIIFQNSPSTATPLNAQNLNHMDDQIALNDQRLTEIETSYVKSFKGRTGDVVPEKGDYDINQINATDGQNGYVPVWRNNGTEQTPDWGFVMEPQSGSGTGGHTIVDQDGNDMASEDDLQFADSFLTDDPINGRTVVENVKELTLAELSQATERGMYLATDEESVPIGEIDEDVVSVTADGNTTYAQLLKDLNADVTKITDSAVISVGGQLFNVAYDGSEFWFTRSFIDGNTQRMSFDRLRRMSNGNWSCITIDTSNTMTDQSSLLIPQGTVIAFHYGTSSGIVELNTDARHCMMSDGESVESAISKNEIKSASFSGTTDGSGNALIATANDKVLISVEITSNNYVYYPFRWGTSFYYAHVMDLSGGSKVGETVSGVFYYIDR